jgi:hypothetical protein
VAKKNSPKKVGKRIEEVGTGPDVTVTVPGTGHEVRRVLTGVSVRGDWNQAVTREIALDETLIPEAELQDELAGDRIRLFSQDARDLYRQRCVNEAGRRGHPVAEPGQIPADEDTTVIEVGDALFASARP